MRLFDTPGDTVAEITTDGATIKPFLNAVDPVAKEVRLQFTDTGLYVEALDTANVFMGKVHLDALACESYDLEKETTIGVNVSELKSLVRRARKYEDDELRLHVQERELTATVVRGYENSNVVSQGTMELIDPDAIRSTDSLPDLDTVEFTVGYEPFTDALSYAMGAAEYVSVETKAVNQHAHALYVGGETDTRDETAAISDVEVEESTEGKYSTNYMTGVLDGLSGVDPQEVTVSLGDEFPIFVEARQDGVAVTYCVAPRIEA